MITELDFDVFANGEANPLTWYDLLPGDAVRVLNINDPRSCSDLAEILLSDTAQPDSAVMDVLAAKLLNGCPSDSDYPHWGDLTLHLSRVMSANLTATGDRAIRMRAQRLNYYVQTLLGEKSAAQGMEWILTESTLAGNKPWDHIVHNGEIWWLTSDHHNIHRTSPISGTSQWRIGLPTQIDQLEDGRLAFGSIYSEGAMLTDGTHWQTIEHDKPVVMVFSYSGNTHFLDHAGRIYADCPRQLLAQVPCQQVHFARFFNDKVYCLDNMDFGHLTIYDIANRETKRINILPVRVCNDITVVGETYYLIDKQQGCVFKFDRDWNFLCQMLRFGRGSGCLMDPVSLRYQENKLTVLSWLSGQLTELKPF